MVTPKYVLTAGHCFAEESPDYFPIDKLRLAFGIDNLEDLKLPFILVIKKIEIRNIKAVFPHPNYKYPEAN